MLERAKRYLVNIRNNPRVLGAVLLPPLGIWMLLYGYVRPQTSQDKKEFLVLIAQSVAGVALLGGLFFTWWNMEIARDTTSRNLEIANETLRIAQDGQITERFSTAIEQLGDRNRPEVRLGGIHALERIARNSEDDHWPIIEVLTAFVRQNASRSSESMATSEPVESESIKPPPDIQAILNVLGRTVKPFNQRADYQRVDLRNTDLRGASFLRSNLEGVMLGGANLTSADFRQTCLRQADLTDAVLARADLRGANLVDTVLVGANLNSTDFAEILSFDDWDTDSCAFVPQDEPTFVGVVGLTWCQLNSAASVRDAALPGNISGNVDDCN